MEGREARYYVTNPQVIHETIDGETIIIDLASGTYFSLLGAAPAIWNGLAGGESDQEIIDRLQSSTTAEAAEIEASVQSFLAELVTDQLIAPRVDGAGAPASANAAPAQPPVPPTGSVGPVAFVTPKLERFTDMQEIILLDPVHKVDSQGWPQAATSASESV